MGVKLSEILAIYKPEQLNSFIKKYSGFDLEERNIKYEDVKDNWKFVGDNESNLSTINILKDPGKGLIERITNGIDAVIENEKNKHSIEKTKKVDDIIKIAFPKYYQNRFDVLRGIQEKQNAVETKNKVIVAINDSRRSSRPTIDVIDEGTGIEGKKFKDTILSIHKGNKIKTDKNYLIGAFGQGGSTSLPFSFATIIISKYENKYYFTVVKRCYFDDMKMDTYVYLTLNDEISTVVKDINDTDNYLNYFISSESGTLVRMIDSELPKEYRDGDATKPGKLHDYINTELYRVGLPVKVIENRENYISNIHAQDRYCYGSYYKIMTSKKYVKRENQGTISIIHNNIEYKINYYFILPEDKEKWAKDSECKSVFNQFNIHLDPIIYTVNGQYISSEGFTRLKNAGLSFLQYRLLVDIDLDMLGKDKYRFFTSDRSRIQNSDLTNGFLDKVIEALKNETNIVEMNNLIANMSINSTINEDMLNDISKNIKNVYNKFLKANGRIIPGGNRHHLNPTPEVDYLDSINIMEITNIKDSYYKNENINIMLKTGARKSVNERANINMFLNGRQYNDYSVSFMNGRIQYTLSNLEPNNYEIDFELFEGNIVNCLKSNKYTFNILNEDKELTNNRTSEKSLDIQIIPVEDKELIIDVIKNEVDKNIKIYICLNHELLKNNIYGRSTSEDEVANIKNKLVEPLTLFTLFQGEKYDNLEVEDKNKIALSLCNTIYITSYN